MFGKKHLIEKTTFFPAPAEEVFKFHACISNMSTLLPGHLKVGIIGAPCYVELGDVVHLKISLYALTFDWKATIVEYNPYHSFVDVIKKGPFSYWRHTHIFTPQDGGTLMTDQLEYRVGFGFFGALASILFVKNELNRIFETRHEKALIFFEKQLHNL